MRKLPLVEGGALTAVRRGAAFSYGACKPGLCAVSCNKRRSSLETSFALAVVMVVALVVMMGSIAWQVPELGASGIVVDFDAFYIVGQMIREGALVEAYDPEILQARQSALAGRDIFMPWTYPPQFDLVVSALPFASRGVSYLVFTGLTLVLFLVALRSVAELWFAGALFLTFPALMIAVLCGQSGLLIAGLVGAFSLMARRGQAGAGLPLGLMVLKPHLGVALGFLALMTRQWAMLGLATAVVVVSSLGAGMLFGAEIWPAFLTATRSASANMADGLYPLFRMTSVYALLSSFGLDAGLAFAVHGLCALAALATVTWAVRQGWSRACCLGVSALATLMISPYNYDYDMPILAIGFALLAPVLSRHACGGEKILLWVGSWICTGWGWLAAQLFQEEETFARSRDLPSLGAAGLLLVFILVWRILLRAARDTASPKAGSDWHRVETAGG